MIGAITLASYNVLQMETEEGIRRLGHSIESNWDERAPRLRENIGGADLVCVQETSPAMTQEINGYFNILTHAEHVGQREAHSTAIMANGRLGEVQQCFSWLAPGAKSRRAACIMFKLPASDLRLLAVSVHLDGYYEPTENMTKLEAAKEQGYRQLAYYLERTEDYKARRKADIIVMAGDYNEQMIPRGIEFRRHMLMSQNGFMNDADESPTEPSTGRRLDWIYVWSRIPHELKAATTPPPYPAASDHLPIKSRLTLC